MRLNSSRSIIALSVTAVLALSGCSSTNEHINAEPFAAQETLIMPSDNNDVLSPPEEVSNETVSTPAPIAEQIPQDNDDPLLDDLAALNDNVEETQVTEPPIEESSTSRPAKQVFHFGFNQSALSTEEQDIIKQHGRFLSEHTEQKITLHGHADAQGDVNYNRHLSEQRAKHASELLKAEGALPAQIELLSWGSDTPAGSKTDWKTNRRVEINYDDGQIATNQ